MNDLEEQEWDAWAVAWRSASPPPPQHPRNRRPVVKMSGTRSWGIWTHAADLALISIIIASLAMGKNVTLTALHLFVLGSMIGGIRQLRRQPPWLIPSGYDTLALHLERAQLACEAARGRAGALTLLLLGASLACGPATWAAWAILNGDSVIPHLPPILRSSLVGSVALLYAFRVAILSRDLRRQANELEETRLRLLGETGGL